jgi:hypothetical protein
MTFMVITCMSPDIYGYNMYESFVRLFSLKIFVKYNLNLE